MSNRPSRPFPSRNGWMASLFSHVAVWEYRGPSAEEHVHKEALEFDHVAPTQRSYR